MLVVMATAVPASAATSWKVQTVSGRVVGRIMPSSQVPGIQSDPDLYCYVERNAKSYVPAVGFMDLYADGPIHYIDSSGGPGVAGAVQISPTLVEVHPTGVRSCAGEAWPIGVLWTSSGTLGAGGSDSDQ